MKKIISLLLALVLSTLVLVSCGDSDNGVATLDGKTPEELYELSQQSLAAATSYTVNATQVITMSAGGQSMTINQVVISEINGDEAHLKATNDMESSMNMEVWYVDGIVYSSMFGIKAKAEVDKEAFMEEYMDKDPSESTLLDIPESWYKNIKFQKTGDDWYIKFVISGEKYTEYFAEAGLGGTITGDVTHKVFFDDDGNLEKITTSFDLDMQGISAHCDSISTVTIGNVTITAPADADSYQAVDIPGV